MAYRHLICALAAAAILIWAGSSPAQEVKYIVDFLQVTVRTGPSTENKVIHVLKTGDKVTVLEKNQSGWVKVRLDGGVEGWMLNRYLMDAMPASARLKALSPQAKEQGQRLEDLTKRNNELSAQLAQSKRRSSEAEEALAKLKDQSHGVLELQARHEKLKAQFQDNKDQLGKQSAELESLQFSNNLQWFLAGAGVLVIGWIMGFAFGRARRRRKSTLY